MPSTVAPSRNCTDPVAAAGVTLAVNVTVCPGSAGFRLLANVADVEPCATVTGTVVDELRLSAASPPYTALRL